ncbi:MAG TPA: ATP-dependent RNA helicase HrpA [Pseudomonadales bacterium]|nr:ATP-dependent RNA helicase HrpA [Pseudomonadales bacterium]
MKPTRSRAPRRSSPNDEFSQPQWRQTLATMFGVDRLAAFRLVSTIRRRRENNQPVDEALRQLDALQVASQERIAQRRGSLPVIRYPDLPVSQRRDDIVATIAKHQVVVLAGDTGSGKTTQLPKMCLEAGRGLLGTIAHTQPRRLAASSVASRLAEELGCQLGEQVGYQVRFSDQSSENSLIKLMTDGILLAQTQHDRDLLQYDTIIIDEAHERSLNIDFLLGYLKQLLQRRPELKLIITSATIDVERFAKHFGNAPIIEVSGRTYPVEVWYRPPHPDDEIPQLVLRSLEEFERWEKSHPTYANGDVLVFLSGEREIRETALALRKAPLKETEILPLYARLSHSEQKRVFNRSGRGRRVVLATNVAETSLTVPGIRYVVDTGTARISRYSVRTKVQRLPIEAISQASANQRKGRCGRLGPGVCIRLYEEADFDGRPAFTDPEILRTNLASVILQMLSLRLGDVAKFPFVEPPDSRQIGDGFKLLEELGAVDKQRQLTDIGRQLALLPVDPRLARMVLGGIQHGALREVTIIASALSIQDPRERPAEKQQAADVMHRRFADLESDFASYLKLWDYAEEQRQALSQNQWRKTCQKEFLSFLRLREWRDIHMQLRLALKGLSATENKVPASADAITKSILPGLLSHVGMQGEEKVFHGARNRKFRIFPGSYLAKKPPKWVLAAELVETSQLFARIVAKVDPEWVIEAAGDLIQRHYFEPHWSRQRGQVVAYMRSSLFGLVLQERQRVNYGSIDPKLSNDILVRSCLAEGNYKGSGAFFKHNMALVSELEDMESKSRRRDLVPDQESLYRFYRARVPEHVVNLKAFEHWRKKAEQRDPTLLFATLSDVAMKSIDADIDAQFPDHLEWRGIRFSLRYRFDPGHREDGVTVLLPIALLNQVPNHLFEWLVPGMLRDKCVELVKALPKALRKQFVPVPDTVDKAMLELKRDDVPLQQSLAHALKRVTGIAIHAEDWQPQALDNFYQCHFSILDSDGQAIDFSNDLADLVSRYSALAEQALSEEGGDEYGRQGITVWDFGELPESHSFVRGGVELRGFPALVDRGDCVDLVLFENSDRAMRTSREGILRLLMLALPDKVRYLRKELLSGNQWTLFCAGLKVKHEQLLMDLVYAAFDTVFLPSVELPRSEQEFQACIARGSPQLLGVAQDYQTQLANIAPLYQQILSSLKGKVSPAFLYALGDIKRQLQQLFEEGFLRHTPYQQLRHYPRYLKAILARQEKLNGGFQRDKIQMADYSDHWALIERILSGDHKVSRWNSEFIKYRWMMEELRVSIFAQPLGTDQPVSLKRMAAQREVINKL